jgi:hypothetical protein
MDIRIDFNSIVVCTFSEPNSWPSLSAYANNNKKRRPRCGIFRTRISLLLSEGLAAYLWFPDLERMRHALIQNQIHVGAKIITKRDLMGK